MLQLCKIAASNEIKTDSARFLETIIIDLLSCLAEDDVLSECFERWSPADSVMNGVAKRVLTNPIFIRPVASFIKHHVH